jgi:hypothetical protein
MLGNGVGLKKVLDKIFKFLIVCICKANLIDKGATDMTRKDYVLIADALREYYQHVPENGMKLLVGEVAANVAEHLKRDNPRFDREHFLAVVRGEKPLQSRPERKNQ